MKKPLRPVFDNDDTLTETAAQYDQATVKLFAFIYEVFGSGAPDLHSLKDKYYEISASLFKEFGVRRGRVEREMLLTYYWVRNFVKNRFGTDPHRPEHLEIIHNLGDEPFHYWKLPWIPAARSVLGDLKNRGNKLHLLTCYDKLLFPTRAEFLKLHELFEPENIRVIEFRKTPEDFKIVSGWTPEIDKDYDWVAIGNSESDINPALELSKSWRGILIPFGTTSAYVGKVKPNTNPRITTIDNIRDLYNVL